MYHQSNGANDQYARHSTDAELLKRAEDELITTFPQYKGTKLTDLFIATVHFRLGQSFIGYGQSVFATDRDSSHFVSYIYGELSQPPVPWQYDISIRGANSTYILLLHNIFYIYFFIDIGWNYKLSGQMDSSYLVYNDSNVDIQGVYRFALTDTAVLEPPGNNDINVL